MSSANEDISGRDSIDQITSRQSMDIIIGFCGAVGSGIKSIVDVTEEELEDLGYEVYRIRVSDLMQKLFSEWCGDTSTPFKRYNSLQDFGDSLRCKYYPHILAEAVIHEIKIEKNLEGKSKELKKRAFLIDQLKHQDEIELLRMVYQHNFYLLGVIRSETERKRNLRDEGLSKSEVDIIIHHDRKSEHPYGQQTAKAILDADYFVKNNQGQRAHLKSKVKRFLGLIHGLNGLTPNAHEKGMYAAHSASLQSACLSRQVGAAILDIKGNLIAVGRNDVPKFNGGLYSADDGVNDHRCVYKGGKCYNEVRKLKIKDKIQQILLSDKVKELSVQLTQEQAEKVAGIIYEGTPVSSIIEYSRSIHAEMDAITSLARLGNGGFEDKVLYTTTFPCHNCARHIVAVGINKVVYIEPYEKSLALELHDDAITEVNESGKVLFESFEGVSPRRYHKFFFSTDERKDSKGNAEKYSTKYKNHIDIQFIDSYVDFENRVADIFISNTKTDAEAQVAVPSGTPVNPLLPPIPPTPPTSV
ncbi:MULTISPECIES: anti-phage dCTP deaminase [Enterobacteriaceae]|nr:MULTISPECIES: anti-phage dCTP deaminase [Enterobacteriaceae]MCE3871766.1 deaminase [Escherichia coli]MCE7434748.1 deaminase [Klebsiella pneumoniae]MCV5043231.1 anti-phage dCTP deaminase [Escherichia coli]MCX0197882.1 deaminase [Escherichia coli]MDA4417048.1 anti-phage dCTP deaminase [Escherichia coli]